MRQCYYLYVAQTKLRICFYYNFDPAFFNAHV